MHTELEHFLKFGKKNSVDFSLLFLFQSRCESGESTAPMFFSRFIYVNAEIMCYHRGLSFKRFFKFDLVSQ